MDVSSHEHVVLKLLLGFREILIGVDTSPDSLLIQLRRMDRIQIRSVRARLNNTRCENSEFYRQHIKIPVISTIVIFPPFFFCCWTFTLWSPRFCIGDSRHRKEATSFHFYHFKTDFDQRRTPVNSFFQDPKLHVIRLSKFHHVAKHH